MRLRIQRNKTFTLEEVVKNAIELEAFQEQQKNSSWSRVTGNWRPLHIVATESLEISGEGSRKLSAVLEKPSCQVNDLTLAMKRMQKLLYRA